MKIEKLPNAIEKLIKKIEQEPEDLLLFASKQAEEILKDRIFDEGETATGSSFGRYKSASYKKKRQSKGRQTIYKDLDFTGGLRKSIKSFATKKKAGLRFNTEKSRLIAEGQEGQIDKGTIFRLSEKEADEVLKRTAKQGIIEIKKTIKESFK